MSDPTVTLTARELQVAAYYGCLRQIQNILAERKHKNNMPAELSWQNHIEGAAGEMAFAKWSDKFWSANIGNLEADDVGDVQVRTCSGLKPRVSLILKPDDKDEKVFVLMVGMAPDFVVAGWLLGRDGKKPEYWADPTGGRPAYFVPRSALHSMSTFPGSSAAALCQAT